MRYKKRKQALREVKVEVAMEWGMGLIDAVALAYPKFRLIRLQAARKYRHLCRARLAPRGGPVPDYRKNSGTHP